MTPRQFIRALTRRISGASDTVGAAAAASGNPAPLLELDAHRERA